MTVVNSRVITAGIPKYYSTAIHQRIKRMQLHNASMYRAHIQIQRGDEALRRVRAILKEGRKDGVTA